MSPGLKKFLRGPRRAIPAGDLSQVLLGYPLCGLHMPSFGGGARAVMGTLVGGVDRLSLKPSRNCYGHASRQGWPSRVWFTLGVGNTCLIKPWASVSGLSFQAVGRLLQWREQGRKRPRENLMDKLLCFPSSSCLYHIKKKKKRNLWVKETYRKKHLEIAG